MPYFIIKDKGKTEVIKTGIDGVFIVEPHILKDARSYFFESFSQREFGKNFVKAMLNLTATKPKLTVVFGQAGTPTYAYNLAVAIKTILADYGKECPNAGYSKAAVLNSLTNSNLWNALQKTAKRIAKGHLLQGKRP